MTQLADLKRFADFERRLNSFNPKIDQRILDENALYENSLYEYLKAMWHVNEGRPFVEGWHLEALCEHLEAVYSGQISRILFNFPPRTSKSTGISVGFHTWCWTKNPALQFLFLSYVAKLSIKDSIKCRRVIASNWYQEHWSYKFQLTSDVNSKIRFDNNKKGYRIATSIGGSGTGEGGDYIILDDPNNAGDTESDVKREATNEWCDQVLSSRLNDLKQGRVIIVQQRLHAQDYSGHLLAKEIPGLVHLCLPMEYEQGRKCITVPLKSTDGKPWSDPRTKEKELLWPEKVGPAELLILKKELNSEYAVAGQLQQRPSPAEGGIIKKKDFQWWCEPTAPQCEFILQSWDTALSTKPTACYSACTNWGVFKDKYGNAHTILLSAWRGRIEYPDLRRMALRLSKCIHDTRIDDPVPEDYVFKPDMILIEAQANGLSLIQDLNRAGLIVNRFDPKKNGGDKIARARLITHVIEAGRVWLPARSPNYDKLRPFADEFLEACAVFPNDEANDYVDSMSQALLKMLSSGLIGNPDDEQVLSSYREKKALY
jgi:predicted phage terminase large subunit-like protein